MIWTAHNNQLLYSDKGYAVQSFSSLGWVSYYSNGKYYWRLRNWKEKTKEDAMYLCLQHYEAKKEVS